MQRGLAHRHDVIDAGFFFLFEPERCAIEPVSLFGPEPGAHLLFVAENKRDLGHLCEGFRLGLCRAAGDDDRRVRALACEPADRLARLAHRLGGHRAAIDDDCVFDAGRRGVAADHLGLVGVQSAAEGDDLGAHQATAANSAGSKRPSNSKATGRVISTWSSFSRHSISKSPPGSVTVTLRSVLRRRAAATAAAQAAEPQALVRPAPRSQVRTMMCSRVLTLATEMLARSGNIG